MIHFGVYLSEGTWFGSRMRREGDYNRMERQVRIGAVVYRRFNSLNNLNNTGTQKHMNSLLYFWLIEFGFHFLWTLNMLGNIDA